MRQYRPASIINLSTHILTTDQIKVLSKGLKFIPKPLKSDKVEVQEAFDEFSRRVKIPSFFNAAASIRTLVHKTVHRRKNYLLKNPNGSPRQGVFYKYVTRTKRFKGIIRKYKIETE